MKPQEDPTGSVENFGFGENVVSLRPEQDFTNVAAGKREQALQVDYEETYRAYNSKINRIATTAPVAPSMAPMYAGANRSALAIATYQKMSDDLTAHEMERKGLGIADNLPTVKAILASAKRANIELSASDLRNMANFGVANSAADAIIAAANATAGGDRVGMNNIYATLEKNDPLTASLVPDIIAKKLEEAIQDPTVVSTAIGAIAEAAGYVLEPFVAANNYVMEGIRAGNYASQQRTKEEGFYQPFDPRTVASFFSGDARAAVQPGMFNEEYLQQIRDSGEYTPLQFEVVASITRRIQAGDPDPINNALLEDFAGNEEAVPIFQDIIYSNATGNTQELIRQLDSASLGNTGQVLLGAADETAIYNPYRGSDSRQNVANVTGMVTGLAFDPTLAVGKAVKVSRAVLWGLERLAPGSGPAMSAIGKLRFGRLAVTTAPYRYFNSLAKDLNKLDDFKVRAAEAAAAGNSTLATKLTGQGASLRQRMTRWYSQMPEQTIQELYTSPMRGVDGKFTVQSIATHIDEANDAFVTVSGTVAEKLVVAGATKEAMRAAMQELYVEKSFAGQIASKNAKRSALVPRMSVAAAIRKGAVGRIAFSLMPQKEAIRLVDAYLASNGMPKVFAEALSDNAVEFGTAARSYKFNPLNYGDAVGRAFSSIPTMGSVSVATAEDAKEVYRYARTFFPKRTAEYIADSFRMGDEGARRLLLSGLVRAAAASRGATITREQAKQLTEEATGLVTGSMKGERYGIRVSASVRPSEAADAAAALKIEIKDLKIKLKSLSATKLDIKVAIDDLIAERAAEASGPLRSLSADANGVEHAIHLAQTARRVALPNLRDFELLRNPAWVAGSKTATKAVDYWSLGTLFGLRFSIRNAVEEVGMYWLLGGGVRDLYRGRKMDQAARKARPRLIVRVQPDGTAKVLLRTNLGMIANKAEWANRWMKNRGFPEWIAELIFHGIDEKALKEAGVALSTGDTEAFARLAVQSLASQKVFGFKINLVSEDDKIVFRALADSTHGIELLDDLSDASRHLTDGGFPLHMSIVNGVDEAVPGIEFGQIREWRFGDYANIEPKAARRGEPYLDGLNAWWRELQVTLDGDGTIGEIAVRMLQDPVAAKAAIADAIRTDTVYKYKESFSRLRSDADVDKFADDYFENVFQHFTKADGELNLKLRDVFMQETPEGPRALWWTDAMSPEALKGLGFEADEIKLLVKEGVVSTRATRASLSGISVKDRPAYIFGREVIHEPYIPMPMSDTRLLSEDRAYSWMGRQNARISKGPIFYANLSDQFAQTAGSRTKLAEAMARKRGSTVPSAAEVEVANSVYARQAMDNAYSLTLSYVDNPKNRSNLAWKIRNVARYYRATEDFYRRTGRVAKNDPAAIWKGALLYQLLGDNGFTYTNDNGDEYFAYPGNEFAREQLSAVMGYFTNTSPKQYVDLDPFSLNGRVLGLSPSTDPNQLAPTLMGPVTVPMVALFDAFPQFAGLRSALLGPYNQPSGNTLNDMLTAILPAGVTKALKTADPQWVNAQVGASITDTLSMMSAEGMLDTPTIYGEPMRDSNGEILLTQQLDSARFKTTDQYAAAQTMSVAAFILKVGGSWSLPASPQLGSGNASEFAKSHGIDDMSDVWHTALQKFEGSPNQMELATSAFYGLQFETMQSGKYAHFDSFLPFTISDHKNAPGNIATLAGVKASRELLDWTRLDSTKVLADKYPSVYLFLGPRTGKFDWPSWNLVKNVMGLQVLKTEDEKITELFSLSGQHNANMITQDFDKMIAEAPDADAAKALAEEKTFQLKLNKEANPWFARRMEGLRGLGSIEINDELNNMKDMLNYLRKTNGKLSVDEMAISEAIGTYTDFKAQMAGLQGSAAQRSSAKKDIASELTLQLDMQAADNPNAKRFIEAVLGRDPDYTMGMAYETETDVKP